MDKRESRLLRLIQLITEIKTNPHQRPEQLYRSMGVSRAMFFKDKRACQERQRVIVMHAPPGGEIEEHDVVPYQILFKRRALYLDAYDVEEKEVRLFRINRIQRVAFLGVRLSVPIVNYDFRERHRHSFSVFVGGEPQRVRVRFDAHTAPYIRETLWHSSQHIDELPDGSLALEVTVSEPKEVGWWVMQWGAGAEILEPPELRQYVIETVRAMARMYEVI